MYYEVTFEARHIYAMQLQPAQGWMNEYIKESDLSFLENEWSGTLMKDGKPIACAGAQVHWKDRALVWSYLSEMDKEKNFWVIHRHALQFIKSLPFRRLEAIVDCDFHAGHRWIRMLGFKMEAERMRFYQIDGRDASLYSRIKE